MKSHKYRQSTFQKTPCWPQLILKSFAVTHQQEDLNDLIRFEEFNSSFQGFCKGNIPVNS